MNSLEKWKDPYFEPELHIYMIDPHNLEVIRGELFDVEKIILTDGYYSDTKISGSLGTIADNYIGGSWLRIMVDGQGVATLGVQSIKTTQAPEGGEAKTYDLQSVLWMLDTDIAYQLYTIGQNTQTRTAIVAVARACGKSVIFQAGSRDAIYTAAKIYERTDSYRSILADICNKANNQLGVDGYGHISVAAYVAPGDKTPAWSLDADDPRGIILSPGHEDSDSSGEAYNRTVVVAENPNSDGKPLVASADAAVTSAISSAYRGWTRTNVHDVSDMSPFTQAQAQKLVGQYTANDRSQGKTRDCTCMYFPVKAGEVIEWAEDGKKKNYLVQTVESDLIAWTVKLTLKEV
ncbi:hypothetical protein HMP0721_1256 [Pseudoramibacter alactolyticus ATCC 23263]|uniref:Phage tail protein n=1 Tax=Pseudoramibacter alactolyticus ATCC 23263 TaxID=887929 RepID=E6MGX2_9FIRM|nr:hypothetical protein [Pseudoramibacter alactolyticus]EFV01862.1 hypothetical protein HMP0721_1256 [Pseudoramibacter alactolyticus ATCC 23263]